MNLPSGPKEYQAKEHLYFSCQYHVVFCTKYRRSVITENVEKRLQELLLEISEEYDFSIHETEIMPDYVHLLIDCNPRFGIMDCVRKLKGVTSRVLRDEFPTLKSKIPTLWTRNAFISTAGTVKLDTVRQYIAEQKKV